MLNMITGTDRRIDACCTAGACQCVCSGRSQGVEADLAELVTERLEVVGELGPGKAKGLHAGSPATPGVDLPFVPVVLGLGPAAKLGGKASQVGLHGGHQRPHQVGRGAMGIKAG